MALFVLFILLFLNAGSIYEHRDTFGGGKLPEVDAIVVLAGGRGRITASSDLWYQYHEAEEAGQAERTPMLYVSGMGNRSTWTTFQQQVRPGVLNAMRPSDVMLETESTNTRENALWVMKNAQLRGWKRILLVTSTYHMRRADFMFRQIIGASDYRLEMLTYSIVQDPFTFEEWDGSMHGIHVTFLEYMKWVYYTKFWKPKVDSGTGIVR